ncbi:MAG TPA: hypothetical protein VEJ16_03170 [Alphaproteobacteria bacterium]|nr:hypothetical protein [Alphaproteobacteria bacterium]
MRIIFIILILRRCAAPSRRMTSRDALVAFQRVRILAIEYL